MSLTKRKTGHLIRLRQGMVLLWLCLICSCWSFCSAGKSTVEDMILDHPLLYSLPMYDISGVQKSNDIMWKYLATAFLKDFQTHNPHDPLLNRLTLILDPEVPPLHYNYNTSSDGYHFISDLMNLWNDPRAFFTQTCGYPWQSTFELNYALEYLGSPIYKTNFSNNGTHHALIVVNKDSTDITTLQDLRCSAFTHSSLTIL